MQIKNILNHVQKFKSFVYGEAPLLCSTVPPSLEVDVRERRNSWALCSVCKQPAANKQEIKLTELVQYNLRSIRAYLLKEDVQQFWTQVSPYYAGRFFDAWCTRTMRSRIEPMKKMAKTLHKHRPLLMKWFKARGELSSGVVEGFNNKAK